MVGEAANYGDWVIAAAIVSPLPSGVGQGVRAATFRLTTRSAVAYDGCGDCPNFAQQNGTVPFTAPERQ